MVDEALSRMLIQRRVTYISPDSPCGDLVSRESGEKLIAPVAMAEFVVIATRQVLESTETIERREIDILISMSVEHRGEPGRALGMPLD